MTPRKLAPTATEVDYRRGKWNPRALTTRVIDTGPARPAPWRHDHTTEHINSPGTPVRAASPERGRASGRRFRSCSPARSWSCWTSSSSTSRCRRCSVDLHASGGAIEWVVAGYALTSAVFLIAAARLGDQIGRRRMFSLGLALFTLASAACGVAGSPEIAGAGAAGPGHRRRAADAERAVDHRRHLRRAPTCARALGVYGLVMGARGGQRPADRRRAGPGRHRRARLAQLLSDQRARSACARAGAAPRGRSRVARASGAAGSTSSGRCSLTAGADRGRAAARRGPPARLAAVDMGVAGARAADPAGVRRPPAAAGAARRRSR